jgi:hypothetical protein
MKFVNHVVSDVIYRTDLFTEYVILVYFLNGVKDDYTVDKSVYELTCYISSYV